MKTVASLMVVMDVVVVMHALKKKTVVVAVVVSICFVVSLCDGSPDGPQQFDFLQSVQFCKLTLYYRMEPPFCNLGFFILLQNRFLPKKVDYEEFKQPASWNVSNETGNLLISGVIL
jgi:hypothetical protein